MRAKDDSASIARTGRVALGLVIPALILLAWWWGVQLKSAVVPGFGAVLEVLLHPFEQPQDIYSGSLGFSWTITMLRLMVGFGLGVMTAVPLGFFAARSRAVEYLLAPVVQLARPINPIVLMPIATVLLGVASLATVGFGEREAWKHNILDQMQLATILILWWGAFFPIFLSVIHGVGSVRVAHLETMRLMGAGRWMVFRRVLWPHALPHIVHGMRLAMGVTWLVLVAAEVFPGTRSGLGYMLCTACKTSDYQYTFAALITIGLTAYAIDMALGRLELASGRWQSVQ